MPPVPAAAAVSIPLQQGYDVSVVLMTYEGWNHTERVDLSLYFCSRILANINITVSLQKFEPLPKGTFGTGWGPHSALPPGCSRGGARLCWLLLLLAGRAGRLPACPQRTHPLA